MSRRGTELPLAQMYVVFLAILIGMLLFPFYVLRYVVKYCRGNSEEIAAVVVPSILLCKKIVVTAAAIFSAFVVFAGVLEITLYDPHPIGTVQFIGDVLGMSLFAGILAVIYRYRSPLWSGPSLNWRHWNRNTKSTNGDNYQTIHDIGKHGGSRTDDGVWIPKDVETHYREDNES